MESRTPQSETPASPSPPRLDSDRASARATSAATAAWGFGSHRRRRSNQQRRLLPSLGILVILALAGIFAPALSPHSPFEQIDVAASQNQPPGTRLWLLLMADGRPRLASRVHSTEEGIEIERRGVVERYRPDEVLNLDPDSGQVTESRLFLLGTDALGRDLLSRLLHGARVSLWVATGAAGLALLLGIVVGGIAGMGGRLIDGAAMRLTDAFLSFPWLFVLLALTAFLKPSLGTVIVVIAAGGWMETARLLRGEILSLKNRDFVLAAHGAGLHPLTVFRRHLLPNALTPVLVQGSLLLGHAILAESALSFLGYGVQSPTASWGNMIADGRSGMISAWWISAFPGIALVIVVMALNRLGDGLRDRLDPKMARSEPAAPSNTPRP